MNLQLKRLHTQGHAHVLVGAALLVVGFGVYGAYTLVASHADKLPTTPAASTNYSWAGYEATVAAKSKQHFTAVQGEYKVPKITCDAKDNQEAYESFSQWVGLDGVSNEALVQDGVEVHCIKANNGSFQAVYWPWWEVIQGAGNDTYKSKQFAVRPGDRMFSSVVFAKGKYTLTLTNKTTGKGFKKVVTCYEAGVACERASAEWVIERPGGGNANGYGGVLANFSSTSFSEATARVSGSTRWLTVRQLQAARVNMADSNNTQLAATSSLGKDGQSFTVTYKGHGTISAPAGHKK